MERLSPKYPCFVDSTFLTSTGEPYGTVAAGSWINSRESLAQIDGLRGHGRPNELDYLNLYESADLLLEFTGVSSALIETFSPAPTIIGLVRRYKINDEGSPDSEDIVWRFHLIRKFKANFSGSNKLLIQFTGAVKSIDRLRGK